MNKPPKEWTNEELLNFLGDDNLSQLSPDWIRTLHDELVIRRELIVETLISLGVEQAVFEHPNRRDILMNQVAWLADLDRWYKAITGQDIEL